MLYAPFSRAGRPTKEINEFQEEIIALYRAGKTSDNIARHRFTEYNFQIHARTIQRRLKEWRVTKRVRTRKEQEENLEIQVENMDPAEVTRRSNDLQRTREDFSVPGPDYLWSIDGYDKISYWGFQIYAGFDAYTRYVTWIYVGNSNRTSFSVLRQYLDTLKSEKKQPRMIRSDKGGENPLLAAAHYALSQKHNANATLSDCFWYGTSMSDQRIEAWWSQFTKTRARKWQVEL